MRKLLPILVTLLLLSGISFAQNITVSGSVGADGSYTSLTAASGAFLAINGFAQTSATILITITADEALETGANSLNASTGAWTSLIINPVGVRTISGAVTGVLLNLNGAKNVTIDGLNTGGNSLTISNTATGASNTIRFINDASNNIIRNCTILGSASTAANGVIQFSTGTTTGNDGNAINNCNIGPAGANLPINSVYSLGTSASIDNSGNTLDANNIYDYFNAAAISTGIYLSATGNSAWTITNNKLYQTATRLFTTGSTHNGIFVGVGSGYTITGNTIGYANSSGTGTTNLVGNTVALTGTFPSSYTTTGTANTTRYIAINCAFTAAGTVSNIQGNSIGGFALYTSSGAATTNGIWCGINVTSGNVNIGTTTGNIIGATTGGSSIYTVCTSTGGAAVGIYVTSGNTVSIQNNTVGAIDAMGTTTIINGSVTGIDVAGAANYTISNNTIGNSSANNLRTGYSATAGSLSNTGTLASTTGASSLMLGLRSAATGNTLSITGNTVQGMITSGTVTTVTGIISSGTMTGTTPSASISANYLGNASLGWINYLVANSGVLTGISLANTVATALNVQNNDIRGITFTVAGTNAHTYISCTGGTAASNVTTISGNTFTNLNVNTTGSITFISHSYSVAATGTQTINNNSIVTAFNKGAAGNTITILASGGSSANGAIVNMTNNNFSNIIVTGSTTIVGISNSDGFSSSPTKTVTGNTFNNWSGGTGAITGMSFVYIGGATSSFSNNTLTNLSCQSTIIGISLGSNFSGTGIINVSSNTITGLTSSGTGGNITGISNSNISTTININGNTINTFSSTGASSTVAGVVITGGTTLNIYQNNINTLSGSGATSPVINGISVSSGTTVNIYKNKIYDLSESGAITTTSPAINGLLLSGGTTVNAYNNLIGDLRTPAASLAEAIRGISITGASATTSFNVYYNTVYLNGSSSGANFGTTGIYQTANATSTTAKLDLRNNIIANNSTPSGTGFTVAFRRSAGTAGSLANYASASNNNIFYAGTPGTSRLLYSDGTSSAQTLASYKAGAFTAGTIAPRDAASVTESPTFISTAGSNANFLHLDLTVATQSEAGAIPVTTPIAITDDVDGTARNLTTPDIGADEGNFITADLTPPTISYTALINTSSLTNRVLTATITDLTGVATGVNQPVLYWKINAAASYTGPVSPTTVVGNQYTFTFGSGVAASDLVSYFIVAQDAAAVSNVVSYPSGAIVTANPPLASAGPASPSTYTILGFLCGSKTVGTGGDYTTLTAAVAAVNANELCGPLTFTLLNSTYSTETFPLVINANAGSSAVNILTFKLNAAVTTAISGASASGSIFKILNNYTIIDGSNSGGTDRSLTITNTSATSPQVISILSTGTSPIVGVTIKNCILINGSNGNSALTITDVAGTAGYFNTITVQNNSIQKAYIGIYAFATVLSGNGNGLLITGNDLNASGANAIRLIGIYVQGADGAIVSNNNISNITSSAAETNCGIWFAIGSVNSTISNNSITNISSTNTSTPGGPMGISVTSAVSNANINVNSNTISGLTSTQTASGIESGIYLGGATSGVNIFKNTIFNIKNTSTSGYSASGIQLNSTLSAANTLISNNVIYDIAAYGYTSLSTDNGYGIFIGSGGGYNIYFNSIRLSTNQTSATSNPACLQINSAVTSLDIRNNIFFINSTIGSNKFAIICNAPNTVFSTINYNDYYTTGANIGYIAAANVTNLAAWKIATAQDVNSISGDPFYISTTNLHILTTSISPVSNAGVSIAAVTDDIDGNTRTATPDIGADEYTPVDLTAPTIVYTPLINTTSTAARSLSATITDLSLVATGPNQPVLYWKINAAASYTGPLAPTSVVGNIYTYSFGAGVVVNDVVSYFIVAQDQAPANNVGSYPAGATVLASPPTASAGPASPSTYTIVPAYTGTITVGTGGMFQNLTGAAPNGLFAAINSGVITGNITASIVSDLVEPGTVALNQWVEEPVASNFTITISPDATTMRTISGTAVATGIPMIDINGADRLTIDGTAGKYLTLRNTNSTAANTGASIRFTNGSLSGEVKNSIVENNGTTSTRGAITIGTGTNSVAITGNDIRDAVSGTTGSAYSAIYSATSTNILNISSNNIYNWSNYGIYLSTVADGCTISGNSLYNTLLTPPATAQYAIYIAAGNNHSVTANYVGGSAPSCLGASAFINTGAVGFYGIYLSVGSTTATSVQNNTIKNINMSNVGTSAFYGIYATAGASVIGNITGNTISNISSGTGSFYGIYGLSTTTNLISNNTVQSVSTLGTVYGISFAGTTPVVGNNSIHGLSTTGTTVYGINNSGAGTSNCFQNRIYDITVNNVSPVLYGLYISTGTANYNYNNIISDLKTPIANSATAVYGIYISTGTAIGLFNNSVYLNATSSGTNFGSIAVYGSATPTLDMRNNIFVNNSTPNGTGLTVAYRRSTTTLTSYAATSNNNCFYAGTPGASNLIFYDGTNSDMTFTAFKNRMSTRDAASFSELPPFIASPLNLHLNLVTPNQCESGGVRITSPIALTTDYDGDIRQGETGYAGTGTAPDVGADEFEGVRTPQCTGTPTPGTITGLTSVCINGSRNLTLTGSSSELGISYQWKYSTTAGGPYTNTGINTPILNTGVLTVATYYICTVNCSYSSLSADAAEFSVAINPLPTVAVTPTTANYCIPGGVAVAITASGASTYAWSPATGLDFATGTIVHASPAATTTYIVTGTDANGCVNTANSIISVLPGVTVTSVSASPLLVCNPGSTVLTANASMEASPSAYSLVGSTGVYTPITGTAVAGAVGDDYNYGSLPIGFTFNFNGIAQTIFGVSSNGMILLGYNTSSTSGNNLNALATTANIIAPLWDDNNTTGGSVQYLTTGSVGSRVLTVQWTNMHVGSTGSSSQPTISVQALLYEATGSIQFIYGGTSAAFSSTLASIGISGNSGNFLSVTPLLPVNTTSASSLTENAGISSATNFPSGTIYTFSKPAATSYLWSESPAGTTIVNNAVNPASATGITGSTTYTVNASNVAGCSASGNVTVNVSTGVSIVTPPVASVKCNGETATFSVTASGAEIAYQWRKGGVDIPIGTNSTAGTSTLTLTAVTSGDAANYDVVISSTCGSPVTSDAVSLTVNALPVVIVTPNSGLICNPGGTAVSLIASGASTYAWSPATGLSGATGATVTANPGSTTTYTVTGTDVNGCKNTATAPIAVGAAVTASATATPAIICSGANSNLLVTGNQSYEKGPKAYTFAGTAGTYTAISGGTVLGTITNDEQVFNNNLTGASGPVASTGFPIGFDFAFNNLTFDKFAVATNGYIVLGTGTFTIANAISSALNSTTSPGLANLISVWNLDLVGQSSSELSYLTTGTAGNKVLTIQWKGYKIYQQTASLNFQIQLYENGNQIKLVYGTNSSTTSTNGQVGIRGTDNTNVHARSTATNWLATTLGSNTSTCTMLTGTVVPASGTSFTFTPPVTPTYTYVWSPTTFIPSGQETTSNPIAAAVTATTPYSVTVTNAEGCKATATTTVNIPAVLTASASANPSTAVCAGTPVVLTAGYTGGKTPYTYSWKVGATEVSTAASFSVSPTITTQYDLTITDNCTVIATNSVTVTVNPLPTITAGSNTAVCVGSSLNLTSTGGTSYTWTGPNSFTSSTQNPTIAVTTMAAAGTYNVTVTDANTCKASTTTVVAITAIQDAGFTYDAASYCTSSADPSPTITGVSGGAFTSSPVGLVINSGTGVITLVSSLPNTYSVTYTTAGPCPGTHSVNVTITALPLATFSYAASPYCSNGTNPNPTYNNGGAAGTFSSTTGLVFSLVAPGVVNLSGSTAGTYTVSNTFLASGGCPLVNATSDITITTLPTASISYSGAPFCSSVSVAQDVTLTGSTGGSFTVSPEGLNISGTTGAVTPSASTAGAYTVSYTIAAANGCAQVQATAPVTVTSLPAATISYAGTPYCISIVASQSVTHTGSAGGTYTASPEGLSINPSTGAIAPGSSTAGAYTVTYTIAAAGGCSDVTATTPVTITPLQDASFSYGSSTYCSSGTNPTPAITGVSGGTFTSTPAGLVMNSGTGVITLATSSYNLYTVTYTTPGPCPNTHSVTVTISSQPVAFFGYTGTPYCSNSENPLPTFTLGGSAGSFTSTSGLVFASSSTGEVNISLSTPGTYTVTNTIVAAGGCAEASSTNSIIINALPVATISYAGTPFCKTLSAGQAVTRTGAIGGTYSSTPSTGLSIDPSTGAITPSASTAGTYTVTYTIAAANGCGVVTTTTSVKITALPVATITYGGSPFCKTLSTAQTVTQTGTVGGTYTASPSGLSLNASSGAIIPSTSTSGAYTVTYTIASADGCAQVTATASVTITTLPIASFNYSATPYCKNSENPSPVFTGGGVAGTFSSTAGLVFVSTATGQVDLAASTAGTYAVTNTISAAGGCAQVTSTSDITITTLPSATIGYTASPYCISLSTAQTVTRTGTSGGTYSASPAGLTIDASTGSVTPSTSAAGPYTVTYTNAAAGGCPQVTTTALVTITPLQNAGFSYANASYCQSGTNPSPSITGVSGGIFTASPSGLSINGSSGLINLATSSLNTYTVTYTTPGPCPNSSTFSITVFAPPVATFSYTGTPYCSNGTNPSPAFSGGGVAGIFSSTAGLVFVSAATGQVNIASSSASTYTVTNTIVAANGCAQVVATSPFTITALPVATISYSGTPFCKTLSTAQVVNLTGTTGGTYTATPAGLSIDASTGGITPSTSTAGSYTVTYTIAAANGCSQVTTTTSVTITTLPTATISYSGTPFCNSLGTAQSVTFTGTTGGTYSALPAGLTLSGSTGAITPSSSTAGPYTVTYTIAASAGCAQVTATAAATITALPVATFSYTETPYCANASNPLPTFSGGGVSGTFSSTSGLLFTSTSTGQVNLSGSNAGAYTVTNTIAAASGCAQVTATSPITITSVPFATISYAATPYCKSLSSAQVVTRTGSAGGSYSAVPAGLSIDASTGSVTPSTSTAGPYTVTYTVSAAGGCSQFATTTPITITAVPVATFSYTASPYCINASNPLPTFTGGGIAGTFSSTTGLVFVSTATGQVNLSGSTAGTYTITNTIAAGSGCAQVTASSTITIDPVSVGGTVAGSSTVCSGTNSTTLSLSGYTGSIVKWQFSTNNWATSTDVANTTSTLIASNLTATTKYHAVIKSGACSQTNSSDVTVTVDPVSVGGTVNGSTTVNLIVNSTTLTLSGHTGNVIKWQSSTDNWLTATDIVNTTNVYVAVDVINTTKYHALVKSGLCSTSTSAEAIIIVDLFSIGGHVAGSADVCIGTNSTTLTLSGHIGNVIRWESSTDNWLTTTNIANTTTTYTVTNLLVTTKYRAVAQSGINPSTTSSSATITVHLIPIVTFDYNLDDQNLCGDIYTLNGGLPIGGTYSGTAVSGGQFDPSVAGPGTFEITYTYTDVWGCTSSSTNTIYVLQPESYMYIVGLGGDFPDLTSNIGLFAFLNSQRRCGDVYVFIMNDLIENGANALNQSVEVIPGGYTITILPIDETQKLISGNVSSPMIRLNGVDRLTIDGGVFWPYRGLKFRNNNEANSTLLLTNGVTNLTVSGCEIEGNTSAVNSGVIVFNSTTADNKSILFNRNIIGNLVETSGAAVNLIYANGTGAFLNHHIILQGNEFRNYSSNGIYVTSAGNGSNWTLYNNSFYATIPFSSNQTGINFIPGALSAANTISSNYIGGSSYQIFGSNFVNSGPGFFKGISLNSGSTTISRCFTGNIKLSSILTPSFIGIEVLGGNATVNQGNIIGSANVSYSVTMAGTGSFDGIKSSSSSAVTIKGNTVANISYSANVGSPKASCFYIKNGVVDQNRIFNVGSQSPMMTPWIIGICNESNGTANVISNNMIVMKPGNAANPRLYGIYDKSVVNAGSIIHNTVSIQGTAYASATYTTAAFYRESSAPVILYNNILYNAKTSTSYSKHYAIYSALTTAITSNFNDLVTSSPTLVYWGGTTYANLTAWKTPVRDFNSLTLAPIFASPNDLHLTAANIGLDNKGSAAYSLLYDYDGGPRSITTPDMGADEFTSTPSFTTPDVTSESQDEPSLAIYPNPMHTAAMIAVTLSSDNQVSINVYSLVGELMLNLSNQLMLKGTTNVEFNSGNLPAGIYFCRMIVNGEKVIVKRMEVVK